ncbi:MAG: hypothetical protein J2P43_13225 [Candidatus Dormibacteraeota bacterium]|nr:hypothetical protein [Candidatus Dormibacteraeota bacterium]MBO0745976.1 hypothetical protein [Candidatus Dormibacteraeota bacterium]
MSRLLLALPSSPPFTNTTLWMSVVIGVIAETHILTAGLISAGGQFGPLIELVGWVRRRPEYDWLAHGIGKGLAIAFAFSSVIPFIFVTVALTGFAGHFWTTIVRILWVPLVIELFSFLFEVLLVYLWYYTWTQLSGKYKPLHICIGLLLVFDDFLQVLMINTLASYMLTPGSFPPGYIFQAMVNPTFYELQVHRIVGNLAFVGYAIGAYAGWRFLRTRDVQHRARWDWMGSFGILWGTVFTLFQPIVGYSYAKEIQLDAYSAWYRMMLGQLSNFFLFQILLLGIMFSVGGFYFASRLRREMAPGRTICRLLSWGLVASTVLAALPYQFAVSYDNIRGTSWDKPFWQGGLINPFGEMIPFKVVALIAMSLFALAIVFFYLRGLRYTTWGAASRRAQYLLMISVVLVTVMIALMGFIRENGRNPDLIHGQISISQTPASTPSAPPAPQSWWGR